MSHSGSLRDDFEVLSGAMSDATDINTPSSEYSFIDPSETFELLRLEQEKLRRDLAAQDKSFHAKMVKFEQESTERNAAIEELLTRVERLESEVRERTTSINELDIEIDELLTRVERLESEVRERTTSINELDIEIDELLTRVERLESEVRERTTSINELDIEVARLKLKRLELDRIVAEIFQAEETIKAYEMQIRAVTMHDSSSDFRASGATRQLSTDDRLQMELREKDSLIEQLRQKEQELTDRADQYVRRKGEIERENKEFQDIIKSLRENSRCPYCMDSLDITSSSYEQHLDLCPSARISSLD